MILEIDHVLVAASDPEAVAAEMAATLGLLPAGGGVHEAIGTRNALLSLGGPYLELIGLRDAAPETREKALRHPIGAAVVRALDTLTVGEARRAAARPEGGTDADTAAEPRRCAYVTVALRSDDVAADVAALVVRGPAAAVATSKVVRRRPDGSAIRWPVALPARLGPGEAPFLIEHERDEPERAARLAAGGPLLHGLDLAVADPAEVAGRWAAAWGLATADLPVPVSPDGATIALSVGPHAVVFGRFSGEATATVRLTDPAGGGPRVVDHGRVAIVVG